MRFVSAYTQATIDLLKNGRDTSNTLKNLRRTLTRRGHERLYPRILRNIERTLSRRSPLSTCVVSVAREEDAAELHGEIRNAVQTLGADMERCETRVDPTLIGGYAVRANGTLRDATYKRALLKLYRSIVA